MNRSKVIQSLIAILFVGGALFGGYKWGYSWGEEDGIAAGAMGRSLTNCVYLTLAFQNDESGKQVEAHDLRHRLLLGSAMNLKRLVADGDLSEEAVDDAERCIRGVVAYYEMAPEGLGFLDRNEDLAKLKPEVSALLAEYKAAEQAGAGQPATQSRQAKE